MSSQQVGLIMVVGRGGGGGGEGGGQTLKCVGVGRVGGWGAGQLRRRAKDNSGVFVCLHVCVCLFAYVCVYVCVCVWVAWGPKYCAALAYFRDAQAEGGRWCQAGKGDIGHA